MSPFHFQPGSEVELYQSPLTGTFSLTTDRAGRPVTPVTCEGGGGGEGRGGGGRGRGRERERERAREGEREGERERSFTKGTFPAITLQSLH